MRSSTAWRTSTGLSELVLWLVVLFGGFGGGTVVVIAYILLFPEKAEKIGGWLVAVVSKIWGSADRRAVALKVQGEINSARASLIKEAPAVLDRKVKIRWANAERAEAALREGDVVVFLKRSTHHAENVANAVMAYLPKALVPRARRYVDRETMQAIDLTMAKSILVQDDSSEGALAVFYERHLDPARADSETLKEKIARMDAIDLHGWLSRILLAEYHKLGEVLHPGEPDEAQIADAEKFAEWLGRLADRSPGELGSLRYRGRYLHIAVILVALRQVLEDRGVEPYRKRAKRHIYTDKVDAVYLLARDQNIPAVEELLEGLRSDALVSTCTQFTYSLRPDYEARVLRREKAICACLRRKRGPSEPAPTPLEDEDGDLPEESFEVVEDDEPVGLPHDDQKRGNTEATEATETGRNEPES